MAAASVVGLPMARLLSASAAYAAAPLSYDPDAKFDLSVGEVELRRNSAGRMLMARIYQPKEPGPFPTVLDLHGGPGTERTVWPRNQWIVRWLRAASWWSPST